MSRKCQRRFVGLMVLITVCIGFSVFADAAKTSVVVNCPETTLLNEPVTCIVTVTNTEALEGPDPTGIIEPSVILGEGSFIPLTSANLEIGTQSDSVSVATFTYTPTSAASSPHQLAFTYIADPDFTAPAEATTVSVDIQQKASLTIVNSPDQWIVNEEGLLSLEVANTSIDGVDDPTGEIHFEYTIGTGTFSPTDPIQLDPDAAVDGSHTCPLAYTPTVPDAHRLELTYVPGPGFVVDGVATVGLNLEALRATSFVFDSPISLLVGEEQYIEIVVQNDSTTDEPLGSLEFSLLDGEGTLHQPTTIPLFAGEDETDGLTSAGIYYTPSESGTHRIQLIPYLNSGFAVPQSGTDEIIIAVTDRATALTIEAPTEMYVNQETAITATVSNESAGSMDDPPGVVTFSLDVGSGTFSSGISLQLGLEPIDDGISMAEVWYQPYDTGTHQLSFAYVPDSGFAEAAGSPWTFSIDVSNRETTLSIDAPGALFVGEEYWIVLTVENLSNDDDPTGIVNLSVEDELGSFGPPSPLTLDIGTEDDSLSTCTFLYIADEMGEHQLMFEHVPDVGFDTATDIPVVHAISVSKRDTSLAAEAESPVYVNEPSLVTVTVTNLDTQEDPTGVLEIAAPATGELSVVSPLTLDIGTEGDGVSTCTFSFTPRSAGDHDLVITHVPDVGYAAAPESPVTTRITAQNRATSLVVIVESPILMGTASRHTVTVTNTSAGSLDDPTGIVEISIVNDTGVCAPLSPVTLDIGTEGDGVSTCTIFYYPGAAGLDAHHVKLEYVPDVGFAAASDGVVITDIVVDERVTKTTLTCSPTGLVVGDTVTCEVTVNDISLDQDFTPGGTVSIAVNPADEGTLAPDTGHYETIEVYDWVWDWWEFDYVWTLVDSYQVWIPAYTYVLDENGQCTFTYTPSMLGSGDSHVLLATYTPSDNIHSGSEDTVEQPIVKRAMDMELTITPMTAYINQTIDCVLRMEDDSTSGNPEAPSASLVTLADGKTAPPNRFGEVTVTNPSPGVTEIAFTYTPAAGDAGTTHIKATFEGSTVHTDASVDVPIVVELRP
ncbi:MAG: hypothetical protein E4H08_08150, partial [Candidatus Atribacteria bacterium]